MLDKNSFRVIRCFDGSRHAGFEELICQLAHLQRPPRGKVFVRKEGAGGDAGVECYWSLEDGTEHAWQAKYFLDSIESGQWSQIDESVRTAIEKHPNLTKYYVCVPLDRADSRSRPKGKRAISTQDKWNEYEKKWTLLAKKRGMTVDFEYWGAHEIIRLLSSHDPKYAGRALFWFDEVVLTVDKLQRCLEKQEKTLGERYTPKFHVELPIAGSLNGLANGKSFWRTLNHEVGDWAEGLSQFVRLISPRELTDRFRQLNEVLDRCKQLANSILNTQERKQLDELQRAVKVAESALYEFDNLCRGSKEAITEPSKHLPSFRQEVAKFAYRKHAQLTSFLHSDLVCANIASAVLVTGDAGVGKSHLLCDFAKQISQEGCPVILMLGQQYRGGNPLADLLDLLDLNQHRYDTVLGALDAAGEAARSNSILFIDAINEGSHRDEWKNRIVGLLQDLHDFPHISLGISCRSRFDELLIPPHLTPTELFRISHEGFRGYEHRAAATYLSRQGIAKPSAPITAPEFSNPLFLKTCATALKRSGETSWPTGYQGTSRLFNIYVSSLERVVSSARGTEVNDRISEKALEALADAMFPDYLFGLPWDNAREIVNGCDTSLRSNESLFTTLLYEGAIAEDVAYFTDEDGHVTPSPIVRFSYERFCDHFVAKKLTRRLTDPSDLFSVEHSIGKALHEKRANQFLGIIQALSIIIPEKYQCELWDLLPPMVISERRAADEFFFDTLPFRSPTSFSKSTADLFNSLRPNDYQFENRKLELLVQFATEPEHPWNASYLHDTLSKLDMPRRDAHWSIYVAKNDFEEDRHQNESVIRAIIDWATFGNLCDVDEERIRLSLMTLVWFTTTTNRRTRDQATKAASRLFAMRSDLILPLISCFRDVDDPYLQERLKWTPNPAPSDKIGLGCGSTDR